MKALNAEAGAGKFAAKSSKVRAASADDASGVEKRKGSPVKKQAGASKGGQLSKKEREVMGMAKSLVDGKKEDEED